MCIEVNFWLWDLPASQQMGTGALFLWLKQMWHEACHTFHSAKINVWCYSTPLLPQMSVCCGTQLTTRDNFKLLIKPNMYIEFFCMVRNFSFVSYPEDGGSTVLQTVGILLQDCMVSQP